MKTEINTIPWQETWLSAANVAEFTGFSPSYVSDVLARRANFPTAVRLGVGPRYWKAKEINAWMESHREKRTGRPRLSELTG